MASNMQQIVQWFDLGGEIQVADTAGAAEDADRHAGIQGLMDKLSSVGRRAQRQPGGQVSAAEFILEGLHAHKRIGRNEERVFTAGEKQRQGAEKPFGERRAAVFVAAEGRLTSVQSSVRRVVSRLRQMFCRRLKTDACNDCFS